MLDHLIYAAPALDPAVDDLARWLGVRAAAGGRHRGFGTHNAILGLGGGSYLEVVARDPAAPAPAAPLPFGLHDLAGPALTGWAVRCDDIEEAVAVARRQGYDPGDPAGLERESPTGILRWRLTVNALGGGPVPFLIEWGATPHPSTTAPAGVVLDDLRIECPEPAALEPTLAALGVEVTLHHAPTTALVATLRGPGGTTELR
jgi:hypothetical protein